jgi:hypothetical protein
MAKKHMKNCLPSVAIKEMQIKITLSFYLTPVRVITIQKHKQQQMLVKTWGKRNPLILLLGM